MARSHGSPKQRQQQRRPLLGQALARTRWNQRAGIGEAVKPAGSALLGWFCGCKIVRRTGTFPAAVRNKAISDCGLEASVMAEASGTEIGFGMRSASEKWSGGLNGAHSNMKPERNDRRRAIDGSPPLLRHIAAARS